MIAKFWTLAQISDIEQIIERYNIPKKVFNVIKSNLEILDAAYGADRSITADGGYVALILPEDDHSYQREYDSLLQEYHLSEEDAEFHDSLCTDERNRLWKSDTYVLNEYVLIIVYSMEGV